MIIGGFKIVKEQKMSKEKINTSTIPKPEFLAITK